MFSVVVEESMLVLVVSEVDGCDGIGWNMVGRSRKWKVGLKGLIYR